MDRSEVYLAHDDENAWKLDHPRLCQNSFVVQASRLHCCQIFCQCPHHNNVQMLDFRTETNTVQVFITS